MFELYSREQFSKKMKTFDENRLVSFKNGEVGVISVYSKVPMSKRVGLWVFDPDGKVVLFDSCRRVVYHTIGKGLKGLEGGEFIHGRLPLQYYRFFSLAL